MAKTDAPLKQWSTEFIEEIAEWCLGEEVASVAPLNVELSVPQDEHVFTDQVFKVTTRSGHETVLHFEFQGKSTRRPMKWRLLDYMGRLAEQNPKLNLCSVVFYVGDKAGSTDTGKHEVKCPSGKISLSWSYDVKHLWKMKAEELLALDEPALLALVGQTIIENPEELFPKVIAEIQEKVADKATQERLFVLIVALIPNQEMLKMFEDLLPKEILLESPFLRRIRAESAQDALDKGRREGAQEAQRHSLLLLLERQFGNMPFQFVTQIGQLKLEQLNQLFSLALEAKSFEEVEQALN